MRHVFCDYYRFRTRYFNPCILCTFTVGHHALVLRRGGMESLICVDVFFVLSPVLPLRLILHWDRQNNTARSRRSSIVAFSYFHALCFFGFPFSYVLREFLFVSLQMCFPPETMKTAGFVYGNRRIIRDLCFMSSTNTIALSTDITKIQLRRKNHPLGSCLRLVLRSTIQLVCVF